MSAKVSKVEIQMGKKTVSLTLKEVKELRDTLNNLFGETVIEKHIHHGHCYDWWRRPYFVLTNEQFGIIGTNDDATISWNVDTTTDTLCISV